ncbi:MAG: substrate-binding domain-containing protein [Lachnospiraceae bacterium]|nr:substrate-binding domain-containing protein [Lachnospiraceae bacterium]
MKKSLVNICICLLCSIIMLCGCGPEDVPSVEEDTKSSGLPVIGFSFDSFLIERWEKDRDIFVSAAKDLGAEVNVQDAGGDVEKQIGQIEYFIEKKVDAIVVVPIDAEALSDVISRAKSQGIVVVAYDRMVLNAPLDLYVSFDNKRVGELMGEALSNRKVKNVLMLTGPLEDNNVLLVNEGFEEVCRAKGINVVDIFNTPEWRAENAEDFLSANIGVLDSIDAIMCGNDGLATRTVRILAERRKAGTILVTGQDAELEACQRIVQGTQLMTVYKPVEKEARMAAEAVMSLLDQRTPAGINTTMSNGKYDVDSIILDPIAVDKDNIDNVIIDSGFHSRDEVYLFKREE